MSHTPTNQIDPNDYDSRAEMLLGIHMLENEITYTMYVKPIPGRKLEYDFRVRDGTKKGLLIEVQGGVWAKGNSGHSSGKGIERDMEKVNLAILHGHRILQFSTGQVMDGRAIKFILEVLK